MPDEQRVVTGMRRGALGRQLGAVRVVFATAGLRRCQLGLALVRSVDLAQLVVISAYLIGSEGVGAVAVYGVVRAVAPALGVPVVVTVTGRLGHGRLLRLLATGAGAGTLGMVAVIATGGPTPVLLGLAALVHIALGAFRPVTSALMPALVRTPEQLVACTAAAGFLDAATTFLGPLLAAGLLALTEPAWALAATVGLLVAAAVLAAGLPRPPALPPGPGAGVGAGAFRTFVTTPEVAVIGGLGLLQTLVRGAVYVLVVVFTVEVMGLGESVVGLLLGAIGVGGMVALPLAIAIVGRRRLYRGFGVGIALWGAPVALAASVPELAVVLLLFAVVGLGNDLIDISAFTALPRAVPDRVLAGVLGLLEGMLQIGMALGAALAGVLLLVLDAGTAMLVIGVLLPVAALLAAPWLRRFDERLETHDVESELLRRQPPFADLPMPVLDSVAARLDAASFGRDEVIMSQGERGDRYVLIVEGSVRIVRDEVTVAELTDGDAFGEIALVRDVPRTATAVSATAVEARCLDRESFLAALGCDPRARAAAEQVADARSAPDHGRQ